MEREAIEHGSTRGGRWLRDRRLALAFWVAVAEGVLVLVDAIPWWVVFVAAAVALVFYVALGRNLRSDSARQLSWVAAASQILVALVPVFMVILTALAVVALVVLAIAALALLFLDRR